MFPSENNFLQLLAYAKDQKQKKNIIRFINKSQFKVVKNIAQKILNGDIHLKNNQFRILKNKKLFLRKLSQGKIKITDLCREYIVVSYIVKLAIQQYETCPKISSRSARKMGKNRRQYSCERSVSEISSTEEYFTSEESNLSGEESEKSAGFGENSASETNSDVSFPNSEKRTKAMKLFEYLIRYKFFTLNSHGEIIQNGKNIHDSNILELIAHAVQMIHLLHWNEIFLQNVKEKEYS